MTSPPAHAHRAHHSKLALVLALGYAACGGTSLPRPDRVQVVAADYVAVPVAPLPPPVEIVPAPPSADAVWIDGTWAWTSERYQWEPGTWVVPPPGARYARWVVVRRREDGQLFFAPSSWRDAKGAKIAAPPPLVRARSRPFDEPR